MFIEKFISGPIATNTYVVTSSLTRESFIIDAAPGSFEHVSNYLTSYGLKCVGILLTHSHWDHIADVSKIKDAYQVPVFIHQLDVPNLEKPGSDSLPCFLDIPKIQPDFLLDENTPLTLGNLHFQVIHTPGHSPGSICLYENTQHVLFSGDTVFRGSIGKICFPTSCPDLMWPSLEKLSKLPESTRIFPGHGEETTIGQESWLSNAKHYFG